MTNVLVKKIKRKMISMSINDSIIKEKFWVDKIEKWGNFVKAIFHIYNMTFNKTILPSC